MIKRIKNTWAVVYKNRRTTFAGILCAISTWLFSKQAISAEDFITLLGYCTTLGLFLSKDGQTQNEYDKEHQKGVYKRFNTWK